MKWYEKGILFLVLYSVAMLFVEMSTGSQNSLSGNQFFLWSERACAGVLTLEVLLRLWYCSPHTKKGTDTRYFKSPEIVFDLLAVVPFWLGFIIVDPEGLAIIRSMRILRLLKFYRASPVAHSVLGSLIEQREKLRLVLSICTIVVLFAGVSMHHLEGTQVPGVQAFDSLWSSMWWAIVTLTTVGYGDMSPTTVAGQTVATVIMVTSIGIVGALIGIVSTAFNVDAEESKLSTKIETLLETAQEMGERERHEHE